MVEMEVEVTAEMEMEMEVMGEMEMETLYGFDFGATGTYYNPNDYKTPHNYAREAKIILGWEQEGRIKIMRST